LAFFAGTAFLSFKLPLLDALGPGPGFFPLILALLGGALAVALIAQLARDPQAPTGEPLPDPEPFVPDGGAIFRIVGIIVLLLAAFTALDPLGYRLTSFIFIVLMLLVLGVRNYLAIALVALALSFGVFHSFYYWLKVPLPIGEFGL
jgi:putative tricarboxylic transport membrane protein